MTGPLHTAVASALLLAGVATSAASDELRCPSPQARQFDFWIGEWDVANRHRNPRTPEDRTWYDTGRGTDRVYPILDGCAIVEQWEGYLAFGHVLGFSVRAWDAERERWVILLNWPSAKGPGFTLLEGGFEGAVGRFFRDGERPDGTPVRVRFTFSEIGPEGLRWEGARSNDGGRSWTGFWVMEFQRRERIADRALLRGPSRRTATRCAHDRARAFDFLVGDWEGEETLVGEAGERTRPISVESWSIMEGCALIDFVTAGSGEQQVQRFRVRSFVPDERRWIQYTLDREHPVFRLWQGGRSGDDLLLVTEPSGEDDTVRRVRWMPDGPDAYRRRTEVSTDGGASWKTVAHASLRRRGSG